MSNPKSPTFTTERLLFQFSTDTAVEGDRSDTAGYTPECVKVPPPPLLTQLPAGDRAEYRISPAATAIGR